MSLSHDPISLRLSVSACLYLRVSLSLSRHPSSLVCFSKTEARKSVTEFAVIYDYAAKLGQLLYYYKGTADVGYTGARPGNHPRYLCVATHMGNAISCRSVDRKDAWKRSTWM